jgi:hypothetical protein
MKKNGFEKLFEVCCRNEWFLDSELLSGRFDRDKVRFLAKFFVDFIFVKFWLKNRINEDFSRDKNPTK